MTPDQIKELTAQILSGMVWVQWPSYLLFLALGGVWLYFKQRISGFASKIGEIEAVTSQFETLTEQLKANTAIVETVKTEIAHGDWAAREWKTLRRTKLEQLLEKTNEMKAWQMLFQSERIFDSKITAGMSPEPQVELIGLLYFPELRESLYSFCRTHDEIVILILNWAKELATPQAQMNAALAQKDSPALVKASSEMIELRGKYFEEMKVIYQRQLEAKSELEKKAKEVFHNIVETKSDNATSAIQSLALQAV
jgi:hypothetical protein